MKGYPKHFNTRKDFLIALEIDPPRARAFLQDAVQYRDGWSMSAHLASEEDGITDDTHRVVDLGGDGESADWYQEVYGPLPGNVLDRLGISAIEATELLKDG